MMRRIVLISAVVLMGTAAAFSDAELARAGLLPAGTEIRELRTDNAHHYSNGDGTITAEVAALGPGGPAPRPFEFSDISATYTCRTESIYGMVEDMTKTDGPCYVGFHSVFGLAWIVERGYAEWDISSIPNTATVSNVRCSVYCNPVSGGVPSSVLFADMVNKPSTTTNALTLHQDAAAGVQYGSITPAAYAWRARDLTGSVPLFQSRVTAGDWFAVGCRTTSVAECEVYFSPAVIRVTYTVPAHNVGVVGINAPAGTVDSGSLVAPSCVVRNYTSNAEANYQVRLKVGPSASPYYNGTATVASHPGSSDVTVTGFSPAMYANWPRGAAIAVKCSTELAGDAVPNNDSMTTTVLTRVLDADAGPILYPTAVDSGVPVSPSARVYNRGTDVATFHVIMSVDGTSYSVDSTVTNLSPTPPGNTTIVDFAPWTPAGRGNFTLRCSTYLVGDMVHQNDTALRTVFSSVRDIDAGPIIAPTAVDSGVPAQPSARVTNLGTGVATFHVIMSVDGTSYWADSTVTNLSGNRGWTDVAFAPWTPAGRGNFTLRCSTYLVGDMVHQNDTALRTVFSSVRDVRAVAITAPLVVDSGVPTVPAATVENLGTAAASFSVRLSIDGTQHGADKPVSNLSPGAPPYPVAFDQWTPPRYGSFVLRCSTMLAGDMDTLNDTVSRTVMTVARDVRPVRINAPLAAIDSGPAMQPNVTVANSGSSPSGPFDVELTIGTWSDVHHLDDLAPGDTTRFDLAPWQPQRGSQPIRLVTLLAGDANPHNDTVLGSVDVAVRDVAAAEILAPADPTAQGAAVTPRINVANTGTGPATCDVGFAIRDSDSVLVYTDYKAGIEVPEGGLPDFEFDAVWTAATAGDYTAEAYTVWAGDMHPENDTTRLPFLVVAGTMDAGVLRITAPSGSIDTGATVIPAAWLRNNGTLPASFDAWFFIRNAGGTAHTASTPVTDLAPGDSTEVAFDGWPGPHTPGSYVARCSVGLAGDQDPANDTLNQGFAVVGRPDWPGGWREVAAVPDRPTTKQVKEGGWIAAHAADGLVYAAKGYKTREFFCYDPTGDSWSRKADIYEGGAGKLPSKGAAGVSDGARYIYATKGNNTLEFYRYDVTCDSWYGLDPVPTGTHKVKGGTDLAYISHADTGYVYLLKGFKNEFYRFNTTTLHWQDEVSAPDLSGYKYDKGSFLVSDNAAALYAHQAKTHRLYRFDVPGRAWSTDLLNGMPGHSNITGQNKKSKDGGCAAWSGDGFYALKGNNTQEYFRYFPVGDSWQELDTLPAWGRITQRKKKVKAGSDITSYDSGILFALKGNKTRECWRWVDWPAAFTGRPSRDGVTASSFDIRHPSLVIAPNPLRSGFLSVSFTSSLIPHPSSLSVYDPLGRRIRTFDIGHSSFDIDLSALPAGVYLVKLTSGSATATRKLVIER